MFHEDPGEFNFLCGVRGWELGKYQLTIIQRGHFRLARYAFTLKNSIIGSGVCSAYCRGFIKNGGIF